MKKFAIDPVLAQDTFFVADIGLSQVRLMNDSRFPWLVLVPKRPDVQELFDLTPLDQTMLTFEANQIAETLATVTGAHKMNLAAFGNQVRQLHVHVIARFENDTAWPDPVWCAGPAIAYNEPNAHAFIDKFMHIF